MDTHWDNLSGLNAGVASFKGSRLEGVHCIVSTCCVQAEVNMKKYGKQLMSQLPDVTTGLLQNLCTDWVPKGMDHSKMGEDLAISS